MSEKKINKELQKLADDMIKSAKDVLEEYQENPSEISGSTIVVHEDSPFIDDRIPEGNGWKQVIINNPPPPKLKIKKDVD